MITKLTDSELWEIACLVERHHEVFYILFGVNDIFWSDEIPTLGVVFPKNNLEKPSIHINKTLWESVPDYDKEFLICHECSHILLEHNVRDTIGRYANAPADLKNIAQDICINEMQLSMFGFRFDKLTYCKTGCFVDTVFTHMNPRPAKNKNFEFYLKLLLQAKRDNPDLELPVPQGIHQDSGEDSKDAFKSIPVNVLTKSMLDAIAESLGDSGVDKFNNIVTNGLMAGTGDNTRAGLLPKHIPVKPFSFHQYIKDKKRTRFGKAPKLISTFTHSDRRYATLMQSNNLRLPGHIEDTRNTISKLNAFVFMDVSDSCTAFVPDFYKMFGHIESFKDFFEVTAFTFNTRVTEVDLKQRNLRLGGGTNFQIIEDKCQQAKAYPDIVIVITDGYAPQFDCSIPENWLWFLITKDTTRKAIAATATVIERASIDL